MGVTKTVVFVTPLDDTEKRPLRRSKVLQKTISKSMY